MQKIKSLLHSDSDNLPSTRKKTRASTAADQSQDDRLSSESVSHAQQAHIDSQHVLAPVTHEKIKHSEVEEVSKAKEHERHHYHVQHHVQPIYDQEVKDEVHHTRLVPTSEVEEVKPTELAQEKSFKKLGENFLDTVHYEPTQREVVDLGEAVEYKDHHHIQGVIQPVIEKETHERHRVHTTVPIHQVTHEAPIVHQSIQHEPLRMEEFLKRGGSVTQPHTHEEIGHKILHNHDHRGHKGIKKGLEIQQH